MKSTLLCLSLLLLLSETSPCFSEPSGPDVFFSVSRSAAYRCLAPVDAGTLDLGKEEGSGPLSDILDAVPELNIRRLNGAQGAATVSMRGFQATQTAVFLDDVRVPADITGTVDLSVIPAAALGRVEVMPGGASSVYGSGAEGGVVQLFTRRLSPGARLADAEVSYGSYGEKNYSLKAGASGRRVEVFFAGTSGSSDGFQQNSATDKDSASGRASLDLGGAGRFTLSGLFSRFRTGLPSGTPVPIADWDGSKERAANSLTDWQKSKRGSVTGSWSGGGENLALRVDSSLSSNNIEAFQYGSVSAARVSDKSVSARATLYGSAVLGAERSVSSLASGLYGDHSINSSGVFAQETFKPAKGLEITPGARLDKSGAYAGRLSPKLAAVYAPDESWKFSASAGRAFRAPTYADLYNPWAAPAPDLKPETSLNSSAGVYYGSPSGWYARLDGYYSDIKDRITTDPANYYRAANLDAGFNSGLETEAGWKGGALQASVSYTRNRSMVKTGGAPYTLMNFSPRDRFGLSAGARAAGLDLAFSGRGVSAQYTGRGKTGDRLPEYWVFGLTASRKLGPAELWGGVSNIFDRHYAETADIYNGWYPQPGRTFSAGLKLRFS